MPREYPENPLVGVGAIIVEDGRVLLIRRGQPPQMGQWSLPGGVVECGEALRDAVVREAREETGLAVEARDMLGVYERIVHGESAPASAGGSRVRYHYVLIDFLCRPVGGGLAAGSDAADVRWFSPEELEGLNLAADTLEVIRRGLATA